MHFVILYAQVRRHVLVDHHTQRETARTFGISRDMVAKMLRHSEPPGYQRAQPLHRPSLGPYIVWIDATLAADLHQPRKQRHTAKKIFQRLRDEHSYPGGYTTVKDYVRDHGIRHKEMFVPLVHEPGHAQVDFGEAQVEIAGEMTTVHFLVMVLPHSDAVFVEAFPMEAGESFCQGHVDAFAFFGGVPRSILYDNTSVAVARILGDGKRVRTAVFDRLVSHHLFHDRFARVGKGNDKGNVEGLVKHTQRTYLTPVPQVASWESLNEHLRAACVARWQHVVRGEPDTIAERLKRDQAALLGLPSPPFDCFRPQPGHVSSQSLVRFKRNDYSVPVAWGYRAVLIKAYVHEVVICSGAEVIARHPRSHDVDVVVLDPLHFLPLIERKPGCLDQALPIVRWPLPESFPLLRRMLTDRLGTRGDRDYIAVLRLHEGFTPEQVHVAVQAALRLRAISYDAVKHLLLAALEGRPPRLDLELYPHLPLAQVQTTEPSAYNALLVEADITVVAGDAR
jgi:transposase